MISQKESSTEYNPFVIEKRSDVLDCMTYINQSDLDKIDYLKENLAYINEPHAGWESSSNYLNREIDFLKDTVSQLRFELWELKHLVKDKGILFEESCDEKYAEDWRET